MDISEPLVSITIDNGYYTVNESLATMLDNLKHTMGIISNEVTNDCLAGKPKNEDKLAMFNRLDKRHRKLCEAIKINRSINRQHFNVDGIVGFVQARR